MPTGWDQSAGQIRSMDPLPSIPDLVATVVSVGPVLREVWIPKQLEQVLCAAVWPEQKLCCIHWIPCATHGT